MKDESTTSFSWARLRELVKRRDKATCYHCHKLDPDGHCDHLMPLSKGGTDAIDNLVWSCVGCNLRKGNKMLPGRDAKNQYPDFERLKRTVVFLVASWVIPPYPKCYPSNGSDLDVIIEMKQDKAIDWIRNQLWTPTRQATTLIKLIDVMAMLDRN